MCRSQRTLAKYPACFVTVIKGLLGVALLVGLAGHLAPAWAQDELFVTNEGNNSVTVYVRTANGDVTPVRTISGGNTALSGPQFIAVTVSEPATIPTLSEWAQIGMAALLAIGGLLALRSFGRTQDRLRSG